MGGDGEGCGRGLIGIIYSDMHYIAVRWKHRELWKGRGGEGGYTHIGWCFRMICFEVGVWKGYTIDVNTGVLRSRMMVCRGIWKGIIHDKQR